MGTIHQRTIVSLKSGRERGELSSTLVWTTGAGQNILQQTTRYVFSQKGNERTIDPSPRCTRSIGRLSR